MPGKRKWIPKTEWLKQREKKSDKEEKKETSSLPPIYEHVLEQYISALKQGETPWWSRPWSTPLGGSAVQLGRARKTLKTWQTNLATNDLVASTWDLWSRTLTDCAKLWIWPDTKYGGQTWDNLGQLILEYATIENQTDVQDRLRTSFQSAMNEHGGYAHTNRILLSIASSQRTYKRNYWLTAKQAHLDYKATVREGAKAVRIVYWEPPRCWNKDCFAYRTSGDGPRGRCDHIARGHMTPKWWNVFNVDDIKDLSGEMEQDLTALDMQWIRLLPSPSTRKTIVEKKLAITFDAINWNSRGLPIKMIIGGSHQAFYYRSTKTITIPDERLFQNNRAEYWLTVFHELAHAADDALCTEKDTFVPHNDSNRYSWGELIAEMGAGFMAAHFGLEVPDNVRKNSAAYLKGWATKMSGDAANSAREIVWAATRSAKVVNYIIKHWLGDKTT